MSRIYFIMGKSATGKDTIFKELMKKSRLNLHTVISYTTRPIRKDEINGVEYFFVTEEQLKEYLEQGKILEHRAYQTIHGVWNYFTVDDGQIDLAKEDYLMIGTLESYEQISNYYGKNQVVPIYIEVEDGLRLRRALNREQKQPEPKYAELCRRFLADEEDFSEEKLKAQRILKKYNNLDINICLKQIMDDIIENKSIEKTDYMV